MRNHALLRRCCTKDTGARVCVCVCVCMCNIASLRNLSALYYDNEEAFGGSDLLWTNGYGSVSLHALHLQLSTGLAPVHCLSIS